MLLAIDIGNSSIKFGIFESGSLVNKFLIPTRPDYTIHELLFDRLRDIGGEFPRIDEVAVSSVVPELDEVLRQACGDLIKITPVFIDHTFDFGLKINYEPVTAVGTDRLINASAAVKKYGEPLIVCSFGTATTIDAVNSAGEYLGGTIAPGMNTLAEALHLKTSKLPLVAIEKPESVIGHTTVDSIRSGVFFGYIGLVEGLISRIDAELLSAAEGLNTWSGSEGAVNVTANKPSVIATGGFARLIAENCDLIDTVDENLMLEGIRMLFERRRRTHPETLDASAPK